VTDASRENPDDRLYRIKEQRTEVFVRGVEKQIECLNRELTSFETDAERLEREIEELGRAGDDAINELGMLQMKTIEVMGGTV
jgi:hypothetical protein